jgi:hypothetical protein
VKEQYEVHKSITKEILDSIKVGDLIKVNDWKMPLRVKGVSENYFVMSRKAFGENCIYSVCEKKPWGGIRHNDMTGGMFHVGRDSWLFGAPVDFGDSDYYDFDNTEATAAYLATFETEESEISCRNAIPICTLYIKRARKAAA